MSQSVQGAQHAIRKFDKLIEDFPSPDNSGTAITPKKKLFGLGKKSTAKKE